VADEVRLHVGLRIVDAVADARLRAEVDDAVELGGPGQFLQRWLRLVSRARLRAGS
jgi:hypothetical protein